MKKETALCPILEESICSTTDSPENTKAAGDIISMPLSICTAEKAVLYFGDSGHLLQGLAQPQHQAEPRRNHLPVQSPPASTEPTCQRRAHLPGEGMESWAMTRHQLQLLRCDLTEETWHCSCLSLPQAGEGRAPPSCGPSVLLNRHKMPEQSLEFGGSVQVFSSQPCARVQGQPGQQLCRSSRDSRSATHTAQGVAWSLPSPQPRKGDVCALCCSFDSTQAPETMLISPFIFPLLILISEKKIRLQNCRMSTW